MNREEVVASGREGKAMRGAGTKEEEAVAAALAEEEEAAAEEAAAEEAGAARSTRAALWRTHGELLSLLASPRKWPEPVERIGPAPARTGRKNSRGRKGI